MSALGFDSSTETASTERRLDPAICEKDSP
jgi:hypothetical protein